MNELILNHFQKLEMRKKDIIEFLKSLDVQEITWSEEESWSMIQAMKHVQMSEDLSLSYLKKKSLAGDQMKERPAMARLKLLLLFSVFHLRGKFKAPAAISRPEVSSLEELQKEWDLTRHEMSKFFQEYPDKWLNKAVYKHPFVGMLNAIDAFRFFNAHLVHHIRQVHRIEKRFKKSNVYDSK